MGCFLCGEGLIQLFQMLWQVLVEDFGRRQASLGLDLLAL
jgi:hypothetical protein